MLSTSQTPSVQTAGIPALPVFFSFNLDDFLAGIQGPPKPTATPEIRVPTWAEFESYDRRSREAALPGYRPSLPIDWACPCCGRTRFQLLRWGRNQQRAEAIHGKIGWTQKLCVHHDHGPEAANCYFEIIGRPLREKRFSNVIVCGDCNSSDGRVKGKLALPAWWSFNIYEIRQFIAATPHAGIDLDVDVAETLFYKQNPIDHPDAPGGIPDARLRSALMGRRLEEKMREGCIYEIGI